MPSNKDSIHAVYQAFGRGDVPTVLSVLAADASWTEAEGFPYAGTYIGPQAVLENVFMKIGAEWTDFAALPNELVADGDTVVGLGDYSGTYKATGKFMKVPFAHVWKFKNGKVRRFLQITDTAVVQRALR
jgi:uncharacterized protein